jgi:peroxiredoxin
VICDRVFAQEVDMQWSKASLGAALLASSQVWSATVPDDPSKVVPVEVGAKAPAFTAQEVDGRPFRFDPAALREPVVLIFYRGGWCPYCNLHLKDLQTVEPKIIALGYRVLFLSTDRPELLYSSLKEKVNYHIVSDASLAAARAFGVAYRLDDETVRKMQSYGVDLDATQGSRIHELPVPSVFIVDRTGVVRFRYFNADYKVRLDAASVLRAAQLAPH